MSHSHEIRRSPTRNLLLAYTKSDARLHEICYSPTRNQTLAYTKSVTRLHEIRRSPTRNQLLAYTEEPDTCSHETTDTRQRETRRDIRLSMWNWTLAYTKLNIGLLNWN